MKPSNILGGGLKYLLFSPLLGEMIQFDQHIFSDGLVQPPTRYHVSVSDSPNLAVCLFYSLVTPSENGDI